MGKVVEFPRAPRAAKPLWRNELGEVLRGERLAQERILTEVAGAAGVSPQYLSEIERGRKEPSSEVLGAVTEALGLELVEVVHRVAESLGARRELERREAERRERLERERSFAFRADVPARHPALGVDGVLVLDLDAATAAGGATVAAPPGDVYLLAA
ncbi:helix-turn-helix domain-containing protein [Agromyces lapidis]|uniref:Helix-turn-helix domain-containing protein n=1 Tax=Agromyces lapidis TaxID=279574 RepID=A0ABV5SRW5_9MICO|nr:helix-turn-helix transcriptional regulator [Agromyces lapidis]